MLKKGKEEIIYLLNKCIEKFQLETGKSVVQNTNRKNYEELAIRLSEISNQLPNTHELYGHMQHEPDPQTYKANYPFRKYDITGGQIKDALMGLVANPRSFLIDTCYIYLYDMGRQAFERNPADPFLIATTQHEGPVKDSYSIITENQQLKIKVAALVKETDHKITTRLRFYRLLFIPLCICLLFAGAYFWNKGNESSLHLETLSKDFNIMPYRVNATEKENIEGIWLCYTGSPQARPSDPNRYHKVVANLVEIKYKDGYFTYYRYGAGFNHTGYVQFESPNILSIHSRIMNGSNKTEYPRHSLMNLTKNNKYQTSISASWNFDAGNNKRIIGIREVYEKIGKDGRLEEIINTPANASCQCKIIKWYQKNNTVQTIYLKNTILDSTKNVQLYQLIDEKSILLKDPETGVIIH
jgi:hypothetical protein